MMTTSDEQSSIRCEVCGVPTWDIVRRRCFDHKYVNVDTSVGWDEPIDPEVGIEVETVWVNADGHEFEWPCGKREAHGPHTVSAIDGKEYLVYAMPRECPGVRAHPGVQIGGNYRPILRRVS